MIAFRIKKFVLYVLFIQIACFISAQKHITPLYSTGTEVSLDGVWKFKYIEGCSAKADTFFYQNSYDVSDWSEIKVPGHWDMQGFAEPTYGELPAGLGLYKRMFTVPEKYKGNQVFIKFSGVLFAYEVFINGKKVGEWSSAYNEASFNITKYIHYDKPNQLAVRVSTRSRQYRFDLCDNWALSGIYRSVELFCTPNIYVDDYYVRTYVPNSQKGEICSIINMQASDSLYTYKDQLIRILLYSPDGRLIKKVEKNVTSDICEFKITVENPELWTAETPNLYSMTLLLLKNGKKQQEIHQKVGIRELSIQNSILKLNGKAIKLRGVNTHDIIPSTGKTLSMESILKDLILMKEGNINFIRTSHYPPDHRKLDLCDSLGIYVVCEVPFAFGYEFLSDASYGPYLIQRADATIKRDRNHSSVILWSIGNENPITQITKETGEYVKKMDPTRPILYAGSGSINDMPACADIFSRHYGTAEWIKSWENNKHPVIMTEYAHSLGLSFGDLGDIWQQMFCRDDFVGGAIWHFQDQGIDMESKNPVDTTKLTYNVWMDSIHYMKSTLEGSDGIVYADRTPQVDFWETKKVYSPVQIIDKCIKILPGQRDVRLMIYNQYDFLNLNTICGKWSLYKNRSVYQSGDVKIDCEPHDTVSTIIPVSFPQDLGDNVWILKLEFMDHNDNKLIYERSINLTMPSSMAAIKKRICNELKDDSLDVKEEGNNTVTINNNRFTYKLDKNTFSLSLSHENVPIVTRGLFVRTGRVLKMSDITVRDKYYRDTNDYFWNPFLLMASNVKFGTENRNSNSYDFSGYGIFPRGNDFPNQGVEGNVEYSITNNGEFIISYDLNTVYASGNLLEAGISFELSPNITNFCWLGNGPYSSYPDKYWANEYGVHTIKKGDINFNGNRSNVEIAALTDNEGNGIVILCNNENIAVEMINNKIVVSSNSYVSGMGHKKTSPLYLVKAQGAKMKGKITIIPVIAGHWSKILMDVLGYPDKMLKPFNPFYYSYDSSK